MSVRIKVSQIILDSVLRALSGWHKSVSWRNATNDRFNVFTFGFGKGWDFVAGGGVCVAVTVASVASLGFFKKLLKIFVVHS